MIKIQKIVFYSSKQIEVTVLPLLRFHEGNILSITNYAMDYSAYHTHFMGKLLKRQQANLFPYLCDLHY